MLDLTVLDNSNLARTLGVFLVILIWLFFFRVIRAVWVEVRPPRTRGAAAVLADARPMPAPAHSSRSSRRAWLVLRVAEPEGERGRTYELPEEVTVGRAPGCGCASTTPSPRASTLASIGGTGRCGSKTLAPPMGLG